MQNVLHDRWRVGGGGGGDDLARVLKCHCYVFKISTMLPAAQKLPPVFKRELGCHHPLSICFTLQNSLVF
jgi:hypothetical protein